MRVFTLLTILGCQQMSAISVPGGSPDLASRVNSQISFLASRTSGGPEDWISCAIRFCGGLLRSAVTHLATIWKASK